MRLNTKFRCTKIVWIRSLDVEDLGPSRRMVEGVSDALTKNQVLFELHTVGTSADFEGLLARLAKDALEQDTSPLLHLDMHGDIDKGLYMVGDGSRVGWDRVLMLFQSLNVANKNNLCVVGGACFSLHTIKTLRHTAPAPFFMLIAPEHKVYTGFLEDRIVKFYDHLITSSDITDAFHEHLSEELKFVHCEKVLFILLAKYINAACRGKAAQERRERLMTEVIEAGAPNDPRNRRLMRAVIKQGIKPTPALLQRYADPFLIGRPCSFTIDNVIDLLNEGQQ